MTTITWDRVGERFFQTGIDRGVLYLHEGPGVAWNGLTSVEDGSVRTINRYFMDGVKYLEQIVPGGIFRQTQSLHLSDGVRSHQWNRARRPWTALLRSAAKSFNLSYRTRLGNDVDGTDLGYKIHILYNLVANPDPYVIETIRDPTQDPRSSPGL